MRRTLVPPSVDGHRRGVLLRAALLAVLITLLLVLTWRFGMPEIAGIRDRVAAAGAWGPIVFFSLYSVIAVLPVPKNLLTIAGGALFGLIPGAALSLAGATAGALIAFGASRVLGRAAVEQISARRLARLDAVLRDHGFVSVLILRLIPVAPYTAINYAAGLSGIRVSGFAVGSALGMIPGSLAYAAFGAYGTTDPWRTAVAASVLLLLVVVGGLVGRARWGNA